MCIILWSLVKEIFNIYVCNWNNMVLHVKFFFIFNQLCFGFFFLLYAFTFIKNIFLFTFRKLEFVFKYMYLWNKSKLTGIQSTVDTCLVPMNLLKTPPVFILHDEEILEGHFYLLRDIFKNEESFPLHHKQKNINIC